MSLLQTRFTNQLNVKYPLICGAMYPCSNPELVAAVSESGGLGIVQPISLVYVHGHDLRKGLQYIRSLTQKPFGMNIIVEKSSKLYQERMEHYLDIALEEGCRFFITALGNPKWVVNKVKTVNGIVYHDATNREWAQRGLDNGVDGIICVNNRAGGHAGTKGIEELYNELASLNVPLICAGGIGSEEDFVKALKLGYDGVQMGTRFIATHECFEKQNYKDAIVKANENDIVLTERVTGIPLSVIKTPYVEQIGTRVGPIARFLLQHRTTKHWMRLWYTYLAARKFRKSTLEGGSSKDYWQAGKSVAGIEQMEHVKDIVERFAKAAEK